MRKNLIAKLVSVTAVLALFFCAAGCKPQVNHPNQLNTFDGVAYDSLIVTQAALQSMRSPIATKYPQYVPVFNQITVAYNQAAEVYALYHSGRATDVAATAAMQQMVLTFVLMDTKLLSNLGSAQGAAKARTISPMELITELQILAAVAARVPSVAPQAGLAEMILDGSAQAEMSLEAVTNQPIDVTALVRLAAI